MAYDFLLGQMVKAVRTKANMTQAQAAESAGMKFATFSLAERGSLGFKTRKDILAWLTKMEKKGAKK